MPIYRVDMTICATAYIRAADDAAATDVVKHLEGCGLELLEQDGISGLPFNHPDLPDFSFSPAMTVHSPWPGCSIELAEEDEPEFEQGEGQSEGDLQSERHA